MVVIECKLYGSEAQLRAIDEGIRVGQFIRSKALRHWMDEGKAGGKVGKHSLNKLCAVIAVDPRNTSQIDHLSGEILARKTLGDRGSPYKTCT